MSSRNFMAMLQKKWNEGKFVCVGLDSQYEKIPECVRLRWSGAWMATANFNRSIVDETKDSACAYKPNSAFYEAQGSCGLQALVATICYIRQVAPDVPVIFDAKRGDIGNTNDGYVKAAFDEAYLMADAITISPYLGMEANEPFLAQKDKGIFILCRTSNKGSNEFQDLRLDTGERLYQRVAENVSKYWNKNGNCGLVVGATFPDELQNVRNMVGDMPILIPGIGAQGGDLENTVRAGKNSKNGGMIINSSRQIIFASNGPDFAEAARRETQKLHDSITQILKGSAA